VQRGPTAAVASARQLAPRPHRVHRDRQLLLVRRRDARPTHRVEVRCRRGCRGQRSLPLCKNLKSNVFIGARIGSDEVRQVFVAHISVEDELYENTCVVGASPFCNYHRRTLKRRHALVKRATVFAPSPFKGA
jgi:hypothetical protein